MVGVRVAGDEPHGHIVIGGLLDPAGSDGTQSRRSGGSSMGVLRYDILYEIFFGMIYLTTRENAAGIFV